MGARGLVLGGAILGLLLLTTTGLQAGQDRTSAAGVLGGPLSPALGNGRCDIAPCTCDPYGRLTCDCNDAREELTLTSGGERGLGRHTSRIVVTDCPSVVVTNLSLSEMDELISVDIVNVANLTLVQHSFKLSPSASKTRITVRNSSLDVLPSNVFHGDVETIVLENVSIGRVSAFAFANLVNANSITLKNCPIREIEALAFKKFDVHYLHVIGGSLGVDEVPSRAMNDIEVYEKFMLDGVRMGVVRSSAFVVRSPKTVAIQNCAVEGLESEAFDVDVRGTVIIKNNSLGNVAFGAFFSIRADPDGRLTLGGGPTNDKPPQPSLLFQNNSLRSFEEGSLIFDRSSFRAELSGILVDRLCDCGQLPLWRSQILNYTSTHSRLITSRDSGSALVPASVLESPSAAAEDPEAFLCLLSRDPYSTMSLVEFEQRRCASGSSVLLLVLSCSSLFLTLIAVAFVIAYCCRSGGGRRGGGGDGEKHHQQRWQSVPTQAPDVVAKTKNGGVVGREGNGTQTIGGGGGNTPVDSRITMVVPDGRLYRETEFHVIVEKVQPLTTEL